MDPKRLAQHLYAMGTTPQMFRYIRGGPNLLAADVNDTEPRFYGGGDLEEATFPPAEQVRRHCNRLANFIGRRDLIEHSVWDDPPTPTGPRFTGARTLIAPDELARAGYKTNPYVHVTPATQEVHTFDQKGSSHHCKKTDESPQFFKSADANGSCWDCQCETSYGHWKSEDPSVCQAAGQQLPFMGRACGVAPQPPPPDFPVWPINPIQPAAGGDSTLEYVLLAVAGLGVAFAVTRLYS